MSLFFFLFSSFFFFHLFFLLSFLGPPLSLPLFLLLCCGLDGSHRLFSLFSFLFTRKTHKKKAHKASLEKNLEKKNSTKKQNDSYVGYNEGGQLTEAVRRRPYTVVLFDEIEKAHPDVFNMMLQILEDGRLTDSKGRTVDFKNTLIIMTSNVGSSVIEKGGTGLGFQLDVTPEDSSYNRIKTLVNEELKQYFRPEFLNRLDEIIVFRQLTKGEVKQIADIMLREVFKRAQEKGIKIDVTERFKDRLVDEGYNPAYGARPLRRAIMRLLEDSMAERMLAGDIKEGDAVIIDVDADGSISVLNGDRKMTTAIDSTPAGIS